MSEYENNPTIAPFLLPTLLRSFRELHPQATLVVHQETTDKLLERCNQGAIDLAIVALPVTKQYLEVEPLFDEEQLLVLPLEHALTDQRQVTAADIQAYPSVLLDETHCLADNILSFCRQRWFHPVSVEHTSQLATVHELVSLNHGISPIPAMARDVDASHRRSYRSVSGPKLTRTIALVWNLYRFQSRLVENFKAHCRATKNPAPTASKPRLSQSCSKNDPGPR